MQNIDQVKNLLTGLEVVDSFLKSRTYKGEELAQAALAHNTICLLYTSPSPRDLSTSRMPSSA